VTADGAIEAALPSALAEANGVSVGDRLTATAPTDDPVASPAQVTLVVVGVWDPAEPTDFRWIIAPDRLANRVFVDVGVITDLLVGQTPDLIRTAAWYTVLDTSTLSTGDVDRLIGRAGVVHDRAARLLAGIDRTIDPIDGLLEFRDRSGALARSLGAHAAPTMGLILVFIMLLVALTTGERRGELAVLRSRGARRRQLLGQVGVEAGLLAGGALAVGLASSLVLAGLMGRTVTFLDFADPVALTVHLSTPAWVAGAAVAAGAVVLQLIPVIGASKATVVTHDELAAGVIRRPWWQRSSFDFVLIAVVAVIGYQLLGDEPDVGSGALVDPTVVLLPALGSLAVGLVVLRLLPVLLELGAKALGVTSSVVGLFAVRRAARSPGHNNVPILLLVVTVGLAVFTASLARTLDLQLFDETHHRVGADWSLFEEDSAAAPSIRGVPLGPRSLAAMSEFEAVPGVERATRVGRFAGRLRTAADRVVGVTYFGIDPESFADVAFYRSDFSATVSFPDAIAAVAGGLEAVLVHPSLGLRIGDEVAAEVNTSGRLLSPLRVVVVGYLDEFPTWYEGVDDPFVIGDLDLLFLQAGEASNYRVWLRLDGTDPTTTAAALAESFSLVESSGPLPQIAATLALPERQGVFGLLSIGFLASILVSMLGFFFVALYKVRLSTVELGALQAIGLAPRRVAGIVVAELGILMAAGLGGGMLTGWGLSRWLIVRLVGDTGLTATPALLAEIDRAALGTVAALLLSLFVVTAIALVLVLRRMRVFEALKMGEVL
jgi:putative ABC transport system permease protein